MKYILVAFISAIPAEIKAYFHKFERDTRRWEKNDDVASPADEGISKNETGRMRKTIFVIRKRQAKTYDLPLKSRLGLSFI